METGQTGSKPGSGSRTGPGTGSVEKGATGGHDEVSKLSFKSGEWRVERACLWNPVEENRSAPPRKKKSETEQQSGQCVSGVERRESERK